MSQNNANNNDLTIAFIYIMCYKFTSNVWRCHMRVVHFRKNVICSNISCGRTIEPSMGAVETNDKKLICRLCSQKSFQEKESLEPRSYAVSFNELMLRA